jgi:hypothetical protein
VSALLGLLLLLGQVVPDADTVQQMLMQAAVRHGTQIARLLAVAECETGRSWDPYRVGRYGERGVGQWHPARTAAWRMTSYAKRDIWVTDLYRDEASNATWIDLDGLAEVFAEQPESTLRNEWTCYRPL